jgi:hypothetical protein
MYRPRRRIIYQSLAFVAAAASSATLAFGASGSNQIVNKTVIYEPATTYAETPAAVAPETITADKYHVVLTVPTRRRVDVGNRQNWVGFPVQPQAQDQRAWARPLDLPTRRKAAPYTDIGYAYYLPVAAETVTVDKYYAALQTPVRAQRSLFAQQLWAYANYTPVAAAPGDADLAFGATSPQVLSKTIIFEPDAYCPFTPAAAVETVTADKWWRQLDIPVRLKRVTAEEGSVFGAPPKAEANDQIAWYRPLEAPTRLKRLTQGSVPAEGRNVLPVPPWGWYAELGKPTSLTKTPATQVGYTFVAAAPSNATAQNWFIQLDIPVRARKLYEFPATAIPVYFVPPTPGAGFELNWWPPLAEPIRPKRFVAQQAGLTVPPRLLTVDLEYAWHQRLNEPVRLKIGFGKYPALVQGDLFPPVAALDFYSYPALDLPAVRRRGQGAINYSALAQGGPNPVVPFAHTYLHTPYKLKPRIDRPALSQGNIYPSAVEVGKFTQWWRQLDAPVREWRKIAWQWAVTVPPTGVDFFVEGGPADEPERVACVPRASREAEVPEALRLATPPLGLRVATVPEASREAVVPVEYRVVDSNNYKGYPCPAT